MPKVANAAEVEMRQENHWLVMLGFLFPEEKYWRAMAKPTELRNATERNYQLETKTELFGESISCVQPEYRIAATFYLVYCSATRRFQWTSQGKLMRRFGGRTILARRQADSKRLKQLAADAIRRLQNLSPCESIYVTRLMIPGRMRNAVAEILNQVLNDREALDPGEIGAILAEVSRENPDLVECGDFWLKARHLSNGED